MPSTELDIILPCFNPPSADWARQLPVVLHEVQAAIGPDTVITLFLVNDGSKRGIQEAEIAWLRTAWPSIHYIAYQPNRGKGHALRTGVEAAKGQFQIYTDIDFPYTIDSLVAVYRALTEGADVAAGVRDNSYYQHVPLPRRIISKVLRWMLRTFLRTKITDTQCGLKGFNARGRELFLETKIQRFLFDLEFIFLASNAPDIRIQPVEVQLKPGVEFSRARLGIILREFLNFTTIFWKGVRRRMRN